MVVADAVLAALLLANWIADVDAQSLDCNFNALAAHPFNNLCGWSNTPDDYYDWATATSIRLDAWHSVPRTVNGRGDFAFAQGTVRAPGGLGPGVDIQATLKSPLVAGLLSPATLTYAYWKTAIGPVLRTCVQDAVTDAVRCLDEVFGAGPQRWSQRVVNIPASQSPFYILLIASGLNADFDLIAVDDLEFRLRQGGRQVFSDAAQPKPSTLAAAAYSPDGPQQSRPAGPQPPPTTQPEKPTIYENYEAPSISGAGRAPEPQPPASPPEPPTIYDNYEAPPSEQQTTLTDYGPPAPIDPQPETTTNGFQQYQELTQQRGRVFSGLAELEAWHNGRSTPQPPPLVSTPDYPFLSGDDPDNNNVIETTKQAVDIQPVRVRSQPIGRARVQLVRGAEDYQPDKRRSRTELIALTKHYLDSAQPNHDAVGSGSTQTVYAETDWSILDGHATIASPPQRTPFNVETDDNVDVGSKFTFSTTFAPRSDRLSTSAPTQQQKDDDELSIVGQPVFDALQTEPKDWHDRSREHDSFREPQSKEPPKSWEPTAIDGAERPEKRIPELQESNDDEGSDLLAYLANKYGRNHLLPRQKLYAPLAIQPTPDKVLLVDDIPALGKTHQGKSSWTSTGGGSSSKWLGDHRLAALMQLPQQANTTYYYNGRPLDKLAAPDPPQAPRRVHRRDQPLPRRIRIAAMDERRPVFRPLHPIRADSQTEGGDEGTLYFNI